LVITARQYGEVVLPDAASGNNPGTRRQASHITVPVQGGGACPDGVERNRGRTFCRHGTNFIGYWRHRGTMLIGAANLSPVTKFGERTGAVSGYKLSRSQKLVTVQKLNKVQMRESGCIKHYKAILGAGAKAKTVTSL
jgi:hypothetical protein